MYRWNSRGHNNTSNSRNRRNLSESSSSVVISAPLRIWNVFRAAILPLTNPINCLFSTRRGTLSKLVSSWLCCPFPFYAATEPHSCCDSCKSSSNNCNIPEHKDIPEQHQPHQRPRKMTQILSKTMTLVGVAFLIHFIIVSTFAEREGLMHPHPHHHPESGRHHYIRRSQRSFRNEKNSIPSDENGVDPSSSSSRSHIMNKSEPLFFTENSTVITAQIGSETYLPCAVRNLGSGGVASWIRRQDYTLLTVGMGTYSNDVRFWVVHNRAGQSWELHIKPVKESDAGLYECQISTHPPSSIFVHLNVVEAKAEILGEPDKHVRSGSTFELVCVLRDSTEPPTFVFWYHNGRMINYDMVRGVMVISDTEKSILTIHDAKKTDSGNYTCQPSNARSTSITVHILNGEKPAAMQHGSRNSSRRCWESSIGFLFATTLAVFVMTSWLITSNLSRNLCYLSPQEPEEEEDDEEQCANDRERNLQLVRISHEEFRPEERKAERKTKSAFGDKVDKRLEAKRFRLRLILSTSRVYISEISYQESRKTLLSPEEAHTYFLTNSGKSVPDVETLSPVIVRENSSEDIINSKFSLYPSSSPSPPPNLVEEEILLNSVEQLDNFYSLPQSSSSLPLLDLDRDVAIAKPAFTSSLRKSMLSIRSLSNAGILSNR